MDAPRNPVPGEMFAWSVPDSGDRVEPAATAPKLDAETIRNAAKEAADGSSKKKAVGDVKKAYWSLATAALYVLLVQAAGIAFFTRGFLLSRPVVEEVSTCAAVPVPKNQGSGQCWMDAQFEKAVILVVDALRFDFVVPGPADAVNFHAGQMPFLHEVASSHPQNALLLKFLADPPTTTLQRLKGLTTGSLPTFIDAGSNFAGTAIVEDNWIAQLARAGKRIAFAGDDTWTALYRSEFNESHPYDSLNVWDLHTVDNGVYTHFSDFFSRPHSWDVAIGHMLGVDHAGHRYGPNHVAMKDKLAFTDDFVRKVADKIDDKTLLVVMGDHGMDSKGDHGGDSLQELEATLWMYSKRPAFGRISGDAATIYDTSDGGARHRAVSQIDLVPTLSLLLGLPVPYSNLGFPIAEAFLGPKSNDIERLALANRLTAAQIATYCEAPGGPAPLDDTAKVLFDAISAAAGNARAVADAALAFQEYTVDRLRGIWVRFNVPDMALGFAILGSSIVVLVLAYRKLTADTAPKTAAATAVLATVGAAAAAALNVAGDRLYSAALGNAIGAVTALVGSLAVASATTTTVHTASSKWTAFAVLLALLHAGMLGSNSYTVREDSIVNFLLATFGVVAFAASFRAPTPVDRALGAWHAAGFLVVTRVQALSTLCREEHGPACVSTFYLDGSSINPQWALGALALASVALPLLIRAFYTSTRSLAGSSNLWLSVALPGTMAIATVYWLVDAAETHGWPIFAAFDHEALRTSKLLLSRIGLGATLIAANFGWYNSGLCIRLESRKDGSASIVGYHNIYGSYLFLLVLNVFGCLLIANKSLGGAVLSLEIYQILALFELLSALGAKQSPIGPVVCALLGSAYFFSTGHQATLPSIQWDMAFVWTTDITFPLTHLALVLNTFGPFILAGLAAALLPIWRSAPHKRPAVAVTRVAKSALVFALYVSVVSLGSAVMAYVLRRHLMVWKIFAPRYMLGGLTLVAADFVIVVAIIATGYTVLRVSQLFS